MLFRAPFLLLPLLLGAACGVEPPPFYEMFHFAPQGSRILVSGRRPTNTVDLSQPLTCALNTNFKALLPMRLVAVTLADRRMSPSYRLMSCYLLETNRWKPGDRCRFQKSLTCKRPCPIDPVTVYLVECQFEGKTYAAEINIINQTVIGLLNAPNVNPLILSYLPGDSISCINRNRSLPRNRWKIFAGSTFLPDPLIIPQYKTACNPNEADPNLITVQCFLGSSDTILKTIVYTQPCFEFTMVSTLGENRRTAKFDAGERVYCSAYIIKASQIYFNPSAPFKITFLEEGVPQANLTARMVIELPENKRSCRNCSLACVYEAHGVTHLFPARPIRINNDRKTLLEGANSTHATYGRPLRCRADRYQGPVITVAMRVPRHSLRPPYTEVVRATLGAVMHRSKSGEWLTLREGQISDEHVWLLYCVTAEGYVSSPKEVTFCDSSEAVKNNLTVISFALEGYILKCEGLGVLVARWTCLGGCDNLRIRSCPWLNQSLVVVSRIQADDRISITCTGYRSVTDAMPIRTNYSVPVFPSKWVPVSEDVPKGFRLTCAKVFKMGGQETVVYFGLKVFFSQAERRWAVRGETPLGKPFVEIPVNDTEELHVQYCCVDFLGKDCQADCQPRGLTTLKIVEKTETTFTPVLRGEETTALDMGTRVTCLSCYIYVVTSFPRRCDSDNKMKLVISRPSKPDLVRLGRGFLVIPDLRAGAEDEDISTYRVSLSCDSRATNETLRRKISIKTCDKDLLIRPEGKTVFRVGESIECSMWAARCTESVVYQIVIVTEGVVTTEVERGLGVTLGVAHGGRSVVRCALASNLSVAVSKEIVVDTPPTKVAITGARAILVPGDRLACAVFGSPPPSKEWWLLEGPGPLRVTSRGRLSVLPSTAPGKYLYACEASNVLGRLSEKVAFFIYNRNGLPRPRSEYDYDFVFCTMVLLVLFFVLFFLLLCLFNEHPAREDDEFF